jgi:hypothetical protein
MTTLLQIVSSININDARKRAKHLISNNTNTKPTPVPTGDMVKLVTVPKDDPTLNRILEALRS